MSVKTSEQPDTEVVPEDHPDLAEDTTPADDLEVDAGETVDDGGGEAPSTEVVQPADAVEDLDDRTPVRVNTPAGALALLPDQTELTVPQRQALVSIGIDTVSDAGVQPHVRPFFHMCQVRGLDPWAREAYLIGRGRDDKRKWTMQVAIDGYRKMARNTGAFRRVVDRLWTGAAGDDSFYREDANGIMRRRWYDQWPAEWGNPGAAMVVIEHLDVDGLVTTTAATADWGMFAAETDVWEYDPSQRKRVPTGRKEPTDMWKRGGPHMLAKCAEALAYRMAFPAAMSGVYTHEEMSRHDVEEKRRLRTEQRARLTAAHADATDAAPAAAERDAGPVTTDEAFKDDTPAYVPQELLDAQSARPEQAREHDEPAHVSDSVREVAREVTDARAQSTGEDERAAAQSADDEQRMQWLRDEAMFMAGVLDSTPGAMLNRRATALGVPIEQFTVEQMLSAVSALRGVTVTRLRGENRGREADWYSSVGESEVLPLRLLVGHD